MARSSGFNQFLYEYTSINEVVTKAYAKLTNRQHERNTEIAIYFGGSSGQFLRTEMEDRPVIEFCSGSSYLGDWNQFGMSGKGFFTFPNGVRYQGRLREGHFHGRGKLIYPNGTIIYATWYHGKSKKTVLMFSDGLKFRKHNWKYCSYPDRRYRTCIENGIPAVGQSYITPTKPARYIPKNCYDTIDGIFNPKLKIVYDPDTRRIIRIPTSKECEWIILNCRRGTFEDIPEHRKPLRLESNYSFEEIRLKGLSKCSSKQQVLKFM